MPVSARAHGGFCVIFFFCGVDAQGSVGVGRAGPRGPPSHEEGSSMPFDSPSNSIPGVAAAPPFAIPGLFGIVGDARQAGQALVEVMPPLSRRPAQGHRPTTVSAAPPGELFPAARRDGPPSSRRSTYGFEYMEGARRG